MFPPLSLIYQGPSGRVMVAEVMDTVDPEVMDTVFRIRSAEEVPTVP